MKRTYKQMKLTGLLIYILLVSPISIYAQQPELVADVNQILTQSVSFNHTMKVVNNKAFFSADKNGIELGVYDGTNYEYFDINPSGNSEPNNFTAVGTAVYFTANESGGDELYKYMDGAVSKIDINPSGPSNPAHLTALNGALFFAADDGTNGIELWKYDGTTASLIDIVPGASSSNPEHLFAYNGELVFFADDGVVGNEFWKYNGTTASLVEDIRIGVIGSIGSTSPSYAEYNNTLYFQASDGYSELFQYNGTDVVRAADVFPGPGGSTPRALIVFDDKLYFTAYGSADTGTELYVYDGTNATLALDIYSGVDNSQVSDLVATGDYLYFEATDGMNGKDLYKYDGSALSPIDVNPNNEDLEGKGFIDYMMASSNTVYLQGYGGSNTGTELWKYDGSTLTEIVIRTGDESSSVRHMAELNGDIYFTAYNGDGAQNWHLWKYDGSEASVVITEGKTEGSSPENMVEFNGSIYFIAEDESGETYVYVTDNEVTKTLKEIVGSDAGSSPEYMTVLDDKLFYGANNESDESAIFVYDGSTIESYEIDVRSNPVLYSGAIYFAGYEAAGGSELWKYDGNAISMAANISTGAVSSSPDHFTELGGVLYFAATDASADRELWKYDGSTASLAHNISSGSSQPVINYKHDNHIYIVATTPETGRELWKFDGTNAPVVLDINPGTGSSNAYVRTHLQDQIILTATDGTHGIEPWSYDGSAFSMIEDILTGGSNSNANAFAEFNGKLYFSAREAGSDLFKIFQYDGSTVTVAVGDVSTGSLFAHGPHLYFASYGGEDGGGGAERQLAEDDDQKGLWRFDGTNIEFVNELLPDLEDEPELIAGDYAYFVGFEDLTGTELYRIRVSNEETDITSFSLAEQTGAATIDAATHTVTIEAAFGTALTALVPTIDISDYASIDPATAVAQDFSSVVNYTVAAEFGNTQNWEVIVSVALNAVPTEITIDNSAVAENAFVGTVIGDLTTADSDENDTHTYTLISGDGDADNAAFEIDGTQLKSKEVFDFETKSTYNVRLQTNDGKGGTFSKALVITVTDVDEAVVASVADSNMNIIVYPNPASDWITVAGAHLQNVSLEIFDIRGKLWMHSRLNEETKISLQDLETGMYYFKLTNDNFTTTTKILIH